MKFVSIIIPYYRKLKYFSSCIKSITNQNYKNYEIIIVYDDEDKSDYKKINLIIKNNKRIKIIFNKKNIGAGRSRNKAAKLARTVPQLPPPKTATFLFMIN